MTDEDFVDCVRSYDIVFLCETWTSRRNTINLDIEGYDSAHIFGQKTPGVNKGRQSGGISVYFRKTLKQFITVIEQNKFGIIWLKIDKTLFKFNEDIYICHTYIPPKSSKVLVDRDFDFFEEIENNIEKYRKNGKTFIVGDLNSRTGSLTDILESDRYLDSEFDDDDMIYDDIFNGNNNIMKNRNNMDSMINENGRKLISLCKSTGHIIANGRLHNDMDGKFTYCSTRGESVTDYLLFNMFDTLCISDFDILEYNCFSDHAAIFFSFEILPLHNQQRINQKHSKKIVYDNDKVHEYKNILQQNINNLNDKMTWSDNIDTKAEILTKFLHEAADEVFSKNITIYQTTYGDKNIQNDRPKWFDENCYTSKQDFKTARKVFTRNKTNENRTSFVKARTKYNRARQKAKKRYKYNEGKKLENIAKKQPRKFWKSLKKCYKKSQTGNNDVKIDDFFDHFNTLLGQNPDNNENDTDFGNVQNDDLDKNISEQEIRCAVFKQKNGKSCGPDDLSAELIKSSYDIISPYLISLFNDLFNNGVYPESWGLGYIVPIFKGGDPKSPKNYRGITLNNILAKIYSQILLNRLTSWTEKYDKISNCQFGYQKGKSTTDCIFILHSIILKVLNNDQKLYSIFIDYEKCYDKINRLFLWQKLIAENVSTKMTRAIKSMYSSVRSAIRYNNLTSRCIHSYLGVKQGDPSSSLLFMMFVNDIISNINTNLEGIFSVDEVQLFLMLYADDQVLFSTSPTSLQLMLNDVETYCNAWGLKINVAKTKVLIFEKGNFYTYYDFYLYGEKLEIVTSFKYLGIYFFKNGCWNRSQKCIAEHASKAMHRLFSVFNHYEFSTRKKCKLFDTLVSTVLNYSGAGQNIPWTKHPRHFFAQVNKTSHQNLSGWTKHPTKICQGEQNIPPRFDRVDITSHFRL